VLLKWIQAEHLYCNTCRFFSATHPEFFVCMKNQDEFPGLCEKYEIIFKPIPLELKEIPDHEL
jgi:hypothetical protein